jgi:hypothetical protein
MSNLMMHLRAGGFNNDSIAVCLCVLAVAILQAYVIWQGARVISRKDRSAALLTVLDTVLARADKVFGLAGASYGYSEQLPAWTARLSTSEIVENQERLAEAIGEAHKSLTRGAHLLGKRFVGQWRGVLGELALLNHKHPGDAVAYDAVCGKWMRLYRKLYRST